MQGANPSDSETELEENEMDETEDDLVAPSIEQSYRESTAKSLHFDAGSNQHQLNSQDFG